MTQEELEKKAFEYRKELVPYTELGYPDVEIPVYESLDIDRAYVAGAKEMQKENDLLKRKVKNVREKLFNLLSEYEIGNYDNNTHQFYKDVYYIHNELMEGVECKNIIDV